MGRSLRKQSWLFFSLTCLFLFQSKSTVEAQCIYSSITNCNSAVPSLFVDLRSDPGLTWTSCNITRGSMIDTCCGNSQIDNNDRCIEFKILLHPDAVGIIFDIPTGAQPSNLEYDINCGGVQDIGEVICIDNTGDTIFITFCEPGNNPNTYSIESIEGFAQGAPEVTVSGCNTMLEVTGVFYLPSMEWDAVDASGNPITPGSLKTYYESFLSCTSGCSNPTVTLPVDPTLPDTLYYEVCAEISSVCVGTFDPVCTIAKVAVLRPPDINIGNYSFCPNDPYAVTVTPIGTGNYRYTFYDGLGATGTIICPQSSSTSCTYLTPGSKSVQVVDLDLVPYGACAYSTMDFTISLHPQPIADITGPAFICYGTNYTFTAADAGTPNPTFYTWDFGADATPATHSATGSAGRNPPSVSYSSCGAKTITLTVLSDQFCIEMDTLIVPGDLNPPDLSGCTLPNPTVECGGTAQNEANITAWHNANIALLDLPTSCATDDCNWTVTSDFDLGNFNPGPCGGGSNTGSITVVYTVDDGCFQSTISATYTIEDTTPPGINDPDLDDMTFECVLSIPPPEANITIVEPCGTASFTWEGDSPAGNPCGGFVITRTYRLVDACGNDSLFVQTFTLSDNTNPIISCGALIALEGCGINDIDVPANGNFEFSSAIRIVPPSEYVEFTNVGGSFSDNCGVETLYYQDVQSGACPITITRTFTVLDSCGNSASCNQTITLDDTTVPTITAPDDISQEGCVITDITGLSGLPYSPVSVSVPVATFLTLTGSAVSDNCAVFDITYSDVLDSDPCQYSITRTFVVRDTCLNSAQDVQLIQMGDLTNPTISCPTPIITDGCNTGDILGVSGLAFSTGVVTIDSVTFVNLPSVVPPAISDNCGIMSVTYQDVDLGATCPNVVRIRRTFTVLDSCSNSAVCFQDITLQDNTDPILVCPTDVTFEACDQLDLLAQTGYAFSTSVVTLTQAQYNAYGLGASVSDGCGTVNVQYVDRVDQAQCPTIVVRTFTAIDPCGNTSAPCEQTFTITDNTPPVITCPSDISVVCIPDIPAPYATYNQFIAAGGTITDCRVDESTFMLTLDSLLANGSGCREYLRRYSIADSCGNVDSCEMTVYVTDNQDPVFGFVPPDIVVDCDSCIQSFLNGGFEQPALGGPPAPGGGGPGTTWGYYKEWQVPGWNTLASNDDIELQLDGAINGSPSHSGNQHAELNGSQDADLYQDFCVIPTTQLVISFFHSKRNTGNGGPNPWWDDDIMNVLIGPTGGPYSIVGTYTATNSSGWTGYNLTWDVPLGVTSARFIFRALHGGTTDITYGNLVDDISVTTNFNTSPPSASDNCGGNVAVSSVVDTISNTCLNNFLLRRTWTATDDCGNSTTAIQQILVGDFDAPYFCSSVTPLIEIGCTDPIPPVPSVSVCDSCDIAPTATFWEEIEPGTCSAQYDIVRYWALADACDNRDTITQTIRITDVFDPQWNTFPPDILINCEDDTSAVNTGTPTVTDICGNPYIYYTDNIIPGSCGDNYVIERTWVADDTCAMISQVQIITVQDTMSPVLNCVTSDLILQCDQDYSTEITDWLNLTMSDILAASSDNCGTISAVHDWTGALPTLDCSGNSGLTVTFTVSDECMNSSTCQAQIIIIDTIAPVVNCVANDLILDCGDDYITDINNWLDSTELALLSQTSDDCGDTLIASNNWNGVPPALDCSGNVGITITFTVTDRCGNPFTCQADVSIRDISPPTINCPLISGGTVECYDDLIAQIVADSLLFTDSVFGIVVDNCWNGFSVSINGIPPADNCPNPSIPITYIITDPCNNVDSCILVYTVDNAAPVATCPPSSSYNCYIDLAAAVMADSLTLTTTGVVTACGVPYTVSTLGIPTITTCPSDVTVSFVVTDSCGRSDTCDVNYTFIQEAPTIICPAPVVGPGCSPDDLAALTPWPYSPIPISITEFEFDNSDGAGGAEANDNCGIADLTYFDVFSTTPCEISVLRTFIVSDSCGLQDTCIQTITIQNLGGPQITCPPASTVQCYSELINQVLVDSAAIVAGGVITTCNIDFTIEVRMPSPNSCPGIYTVEYVVADSCGRRDSCQVDYTIDNALAIDCSSLGATDVQCWSDVLAAVALDSAIVANPAGGVVTSPCNIGYTVQVVLPTANSCPDTYTVEYIVTDSCGRVVNCFVDYSILNVLTIDCSSLGASNVQCWSDVLTAVAVDSATIANPVSGIVSVSCNIGYTVQVVLPTANSCPDTYTVEYIVTDSCGRVVNCFVDYSILNTLTIDCSSLGGYRCTVLE